MCTVYDHSELSAAKEKGRCEQLTNTAFDL